MRWIILILVLGCDFLLLAALVCIWWFLTPVLAILLTFPTYFSWKKTGGIGNWKPSTIKSFLRNWKTLMKTSLLYRKVRITRPLDAHKKRWVDSIGEIVSLFASNYKEPRYTIMFADNDREGTLVNFYGSEFVVLNCRK